MASKFVIDPTININPIAGKAPEIFRKYRKPLEDVIRLQQLLRQQKL